jgi:hypothetical protein
MFLRPNKQNSSDDYLWKGIAEVASIYQNEEEREANRPRRQAVPNPKLDADMEKYKLRIEHRHQTSEI